MNWKPITNLEGLPETGQVLIRYSDGSFHTCLAQYAANRIVENEKAKGYAAQATHWCLIEPPKPLTDGQAFSEWYEAGNNADAGIGCGAWHAALAWERSK